MSEISVIIPVYNTRDYIEDTIKNILGQTYSDFELILIDDGSKDGSAEILDRYSAIDSRVKAFHYENAGAAIARNRGIDRASGKYICFMDSDDQVTDDYLETLYKLAVEHNADMVSCEFQKVYANSTKNLAENNIDNASTNVRGDDNTDNSSKDVSGKNNSDKIMKFTGVEAMVNLLYQRFFISSPWGCLYTKKMWENIRFPENKKVEDFAIMYKLYTEAEKVIYTPRKLYMYVQRAGGLVFSGMSVKNWDYYRHSLDMIDYIKTNYADYTSAAYSRHFSTCFQILSETPVESKANDSEKELVRSVKADIKKIRSKVVKDKKASMRNRVVALCSYVSISLIHRLERIIFNEKSKRCS